MSRGTRGVRREPSGLAYAAGFAGVLFLFTAPLTQLAFSLGAYAWVLTAALLLVQGLPALLALALSFGAAATLDGSPRKSGALPALFGYAVGMYGTVKTLYLFVVLAAL